MNSLHRRSLLILLACGVGFLVLFLILPSTPVAANSGDEPQPVPLRGEGLANPSIASITGPQAPDAPINTSITIDVDDPDPSVVEQTYTITFTVRRTEDNPNNYSVRGTVDVSDGTGATCSYAWTGTDPVYPNGFLWHCHMPSNTAGSKSLVATFTPYDPAEFNGSTSAPEPHQVIKANTATTMTHSPASPQACSDTTLTAAVSGVSPGGGTPSSGTVTFYEDTSALGTGTYAGSGEWNLVLALPPGWHSIHATYSGNADYIGSASPADTFYVVKADSTTTISISPSSPSTYGTAITVQATSSGTCGTPTGIVNFNDGGSLIGSTSLNASGVATLVVPKFSVGTHALSAAYPGDTNYNSSTSTPLNLVINKANSTTTLSVSPINETEGETVVFAATLTAVMPGIGTPGGMVIFKDGTIPLASVALDGVGKAVWFTSSLPSGAHSITAEYSGDASFNGSISSPVVVTILSQADLSIVKTSDPTTVYSGEQLQYQLSVANHGPSPAQDVTVLDVLPDELTFQIDSSGSCTQPVNLTGLRAFLNGANEVPPVITSASGLATFALDSTANQLTYAIQVSQIAAITDVSIHTGAAGTSGPVYIPLYSGTPLFDPTHPLVDNLALTPTQTAAILADPAGFYVAIQTTANPSGELAANCPNP